MRHFLYPLIRGLISLLVLVLLSTLAFQSHAQSGSVTTTQSFSYTGQIVTYTVPSGVTSLTIEARGAEGGDVVNKTVAAGKGAIVSAWVSVTPGQALSILVGQQINGKGTGGGGAFVVGPGSSTAPAPLVVAGGGAGAAFGGDTNTKHGQLSPDGGAGSNGGGAGGTNGSGGGSLDSDNVGGGGGGGLLGNGSGTQAFPNSGGKAFINGGAGGIGGASGGFGGGAGIGNDRNISGYSSGGAGGGYSGGGGGKVNNVSGGGGSFTAGNRLFARTGATDGNSGNGLVIISYSIQTIRYVKAGGTGDGTSWDNASGDLQSQIDIAGAQQVWVAGGRYTTTANGGSFVMKNGVAIYGGFTGSEMNLTDRPAVNPVTGSPSSSTLTTSSSAQRVVYNFRNGLTNAAVLDGFVITGGNSQNGGGIYNQVSSPALTNCVITGGNSQNGGGIYNESSSNPALTNCVISGNTASSSGGGISNISSSNPALTNCVISGNQGGAGGGVYNDRSSPTLINCVLRGNTASSSGGGISNISISNPVLTNCVISGNSATQGGGIYNQVSSPTLTNCLLSGNQASDGGGGIYNISSSSKPSLLGCTLTGNRARMGAALINYNGSQPVLTNTILYDNQESDNTAIDNAAGTSLTANSCLIGQGETDFTGSNNLTATTSPFVSGSNFQLTPCSVAIDAGNTAAYTGPATDLAGNPRQVRQIDIGAYEFQGTPSSPVVITQQPVSGSSVCVGSTVTAMVSVTGTSPAYQWYKDGQALTGVASATTATLMLTNVQTGQSGSYSVVITGTCNSVTSTAFSLTVNAPPVVSITPSATAICQGQSATFAATPGLSAYRWVGPGGSPVLTTATISVSVAGTYSLTVTNASGCSATATASLTVNPLPMVSITPPSATVCAGQSTTLTASGADTYKWSTNQTTAMISVSVAGPYSVTGTNTTTGCSNTATATLTVNPLPPAPLIATQSGHSYPGGASSLTISQNTGNVILMVSGCMGGTITWAGGSSNTLAVSTMNTGVQTFTATCTSNSTGCTSPKATATVTVVGSTLSVLHRDGNGQINTNTLSPYLQLQNDGTTAIPYSEITVRYYLTVENFSPLQFSINYAQLGSDKVHLRYVPAATGNPTATGYIEFSFDASAGSLGANSNSGPIQDLINKQDYSAFDQSNDYSYAAVGQFTPNNRITAYRNGVLFYGLEPGPVVPMQSVKAMLQNNTGDGANSIEAVLSVTNDGNVPINYGDLKVRYYFTADNAQPLVLSQVGYTALGSGNVSAQIVTISPALAGADRYLELSFSGSLGQLAPGASTGGVTYQIRHADYSGFTQTNDYSYQGTGGTMVNPHVVVFVAGQRAYGTEPTSGARQGVEETGKLAVAVLGNPVTGASLSVSVRGAEGQALRYELTDVSGHVVGERQVESAGSVDEQSLSVGHQPAGLLLLRVSTPTQSQTVKVLRQ